MRTWLYECRSRAGVTMRQVATALGMSESSYCRLEHGERRPFLSPVELETISGMLGIGFDDAVRLEIEYIRGEARTCGNS